MPGEHKDGGLLEKFQGHISVMCYFQLLSSQGDFLIPGGSPWKHTWIEHCVDAMANLCLYGDTCIQIHASGCMFPDTYIRIQKKLQ